MRRFEFICMERGCGPCGVKLIDAVYFEEYAPGGNLVRSECEPRLVSTCCGGDFEIWDNRTDGSADYRVSIDGLGETK